MNFPQEKGHNWSGWPGAFCQKCGTEDALENAMALNWVNIYPDENNTPVETWISVQHKEYVYFVNNNCRADMNIEQLQEFEEKVVEMENIL